MSVKDRILDKFPEAAESGVDALAKELGRQADLADSPWKEAVIKGFEDSIVKNGADGIKYAKAILEDVVRGRAKDISKVTDDLATASDLLAELQDQEADRKRLKRKFIRNLGRSLLKVLETVGKTIF